MSIDLRGGGRGGGTAARHTGASAPLLATRLMVAMVAPGGEVKRVGAVERPGAPTMVMGAMGIRLTAVRLAADWFELY